MTNALKDKANGLCKEALICDLTVPFSPEIEVPHKWEVLDRFSNVGFNFLSLTLATDLLNLEQTILCIARHRAYIRNNPNKFILVEKTDDILRAQKEDKLALGFNFQGSSPLANNLAMVDVYYQLGIRQMLLAYNAKNAVGDGCSERTDSGLSHYGVKLVQEMNRVGMIVDCSHTGYQSSMEAIEVSDAPVIFSHSNAYTITPHYRNLKDDQIKACAKSGGVIGINGIGTFLGNNDASSEKFFSHLDYIVQLVGPQHVSLGLDFVYFEDVVYRFVKNSPELFGDDAKVPLPWHFFQPEQIVELIELMLQHAYSESNVKGILGENYLRVAKQVWK